MISQVFNLINQKLNPCWNGLFLIINPIMRISWSTGHYRKFVSSYASITFPLTELLKRSPFYGMRPHRRLDDLKLAMTTTPVLSLPNFSKPFILQNDASNSGLRDELLQDNHPITFYSKKLCPWIRHSSTYIRDLYAISSVVKRWQQYLLGNRFVLQLITRPDGSGHSNTTYQSF